MEWLGQVTVGAESTFSSTVALPSSSADVPTSVAEAFCSRFDARNPGVGAQNVARHVFSSARQAFCIGGDAFYSADEALTSNDGAFYSSDGGLSSPNFNSLRDFHAFVKLPRSGGCSRGLRLPKAIVQARHGEADRKPKNVASHTGGAK